MARQLGVTGLQLRNWLRAQASAGHPVLAGHLKWQRWEFTREEADALIREFEGVKPARSSVRRTKAQSGAPLRTAQVQHSSAEPDHRVVIEWMGEKVETLADLLRPGLKAVVVGINPALISVEAGHYWQGRTGKTLWRRLQEVGLMPEQWEGFEDDAAFESGLGFTDVVKRPTKRADDVRNDEMTVGRRVLEAKLDQADVPLVIFVFKAAAETLLGPLDGNGFVGRQLGGAKVFVMPGPYEKRERANSVLNTLQQQLRDPG